MNILANAVSAISGEGTIFIRGKVVENYLILEFEDTGSGIPEEVIPKIFDPFFTTKEIGQGTGLGLSISYGIIKNHHGEISVKSTLGKGTTFTIKLPISS